MSLVGKSSGLYETAILHDTAYDQINGKDYFCSNYMYN